LPFFVSKLLPFEGTLENRKKIKQKRKDLELKIKTKVKISRTPPNCCKLGRRIVSTSSKTPVMHSAAAASLNWGAEGTGRHRRSHSRGVIVDILGEERQQVVVGIYGLAELEISTCQAEVQRVKAELEKKWRMPFKPLEHQKDTFFVAETDRFWLSVGCQQKRKTMFQLQLGQKP
jgi:hypothetical protein